MTVPTLIAAIHARYVTWAAEYFKRAAKNFAVFGSVGASTGWSFVLRLSGTCPF